MKSLACFALAAVLEIAGCFAFWTSLRGGRSLWWIAPGVVSLVLFAAILTRADAPFAGRAYAAYGGIYIAASLVWLWRIESVVPDRWDLLGALLCLAGTAVILLSPRASM